MSMVAILRMIFPALVCCFLLTGCGSEDNKEVEEKSESPQSSSDQKSGQSSDQPSAISYNRAPEQYRLSEFGEQPICMGIVKEAVKSESGNLDVGQSVFLAEVSVSWAGTLSYHVSLKEGRFPQRTVTVEVPRQVELSLNCQSLTRSNLKPSHLFVVPVEIYLPQNSVCSLPKGELLDALRLGPQTYREPIVISSGSSGQSSVATNVGEAIGGAIGGAIGTIVNTINSLMGTNTLVFQKEVPRSCGEAKVGVVYATNAAFNLNVIRFPSE